MYQLVDRQNELKIFELNQFNLSALLKTTNQWRT